MRDIILLVLLALCFVALFAIVFIGLGTPTSASEKSGPGSKTVRKPTVLSRSEAEHAIASGKCPDCGQGALNGAGSGYSATIVANCDNLRCGHSFYLPTDLLLHPTRALS
jgi:hypothetical protein